MPKPTTIEPAAASGPDIREVGTVASLKKFIASVSGLPSAINGQKVSMGGRLQGLVMGFIEDRTQVLVLGPAKGIRGGDEVYNRGEPFHLPAGDKFMGRVVNALCEPMDGLGPIEADAELPIFADAPGVMDRQSLKETMETGTVAIDAGIPVARGQRQLLIGDRGTGKTTVAVDAIINQKGKNVVCVYCSIGKPYASLLRLLQLLHEKGAMAYTIVVSAVASTSPGEQYIAPYTACMLGEYFMRKGGHVLAIFDDLTKHSWVYRQISLLLERPPGREAYPGDIFYVHSQLVERAAYLRDDLGGGSMTFLPVIEVLQGDVTGYIPTNLISMTDGQLYFSTQLFNKGHKPAVDFGLSVSRIGNKGQWPAMRDVSKSLRLEYLQYQELMQMSLLKSGGVTKDAEARLKRGEALTQILLQGKSRPASSAEQVFYLIALTKGLLDGRSSADISYFKVEILGFIRQKDPAALETLLATKALTEESKTQFTGYISAYFSERAAQG